MIKVRLYRFDALDAGLRAQMVEMRDQQALYDSPFFDLDFAAIVADARDDVQIAIGHDETGLLGFWPLHVRPDKWARPIGGPFSDWHGPVMRAGISGLSPMAFLKQAGLKGMTASGLQPRGVSATCGGDISPTGIAYLPDGAGAYCASMKGLHSKHFKNLRRAERKVEQDFGTMVLTIDDKSADGFEWLIRSKQAQYLRTGKHNVLASEWSQDMLAGLRAAQLPRLAGRLSTLRMGGKIAAAEFNLLSDKIVHGWLTAYDQPLSGYSPGHLLMLGVICDMENTGHIMYDLGAGDHAYKKYYESFARPVERVVFGTGRGARPVAASWRLAEKHAPERLSTFLKSARARGDQIFSSELKTMERLAGLLQALKR